MKWIILSSSDAHVLIGAQHGQFRAMPTMLTDGTYVLSADILSETHQEGLYTNLLEGVSYKLVDDARVRHLFPRTEQE